MSDTRKQPRRQRRALVCPGAMLVCAAVLAGLFGLCHLLGLRQDISMLFGTAQPDSSVRIAFAAIYVLLYLLSVILVPILIIAAGIFYLLTLAVRRSCA